MSCEAKCPFWTILISVELCKGLPAENRVKDNNPLKGKTLFISVSCGYKILPRYSPPDTLWQVFRVSSLSYRMTAIFLQWLLVIKLCLGPEMCAWSCSLYSTVVRVSVFDNLEEEILAIKIYAPSRKYAFLFSSSSLPKGCMSLQPRQRLCLLVCLLACDQSRKSLCKCYPCTVSTDRGTLGIFVAFTGIEWVIRLFKLDSTSLLFIEIPNLCRLPQRSLFVFPFPPTSNLSQLRVAAAIQDFTCFKIADFKTTLSLILVPLSCQWSLRSLPSY